MSALPVSPVTPDPAAAAVATDQTNQPDDDATLSEFEQGVIREFAERGQGGEGQQEGQQEDQPAAADADQSAAPLGSSPATDFPAGTVTPPPDSSAPPADATADTPPSPDAATDDGTTADAPDTYLGRQRSDI